jgi:hypothetical protein
MEKMMYKPWTPIKFGDKWCVITEVVELTEKSGTIRVLGNGMDDAAQWDTKEECQAFIDAVSKLSTMGRV